MRKVGIAVADADISSAIGALLESEGWSSAQVRSPEALGLATVMSGSAGDELCDALVCDARFHQVLGDFAPKTVVIASTAEEALRLALRVGAREAIAWPGERRLLAGAVSSAASSQKRSDSNRVGITSARSCGATAFTAHLAAALARDGISCVAIDCDLAHADLTGLLLDREPTLAIEDAVIDGLTIGSVVTDAGGFGLVPAQGGRTLSRDAMHAVERWLQTGGKAEARVEIYDIPSAWLCAIGDALPGALAWLDLLIMAVPLDFSGVRRGRRIAEAWGEHDLPTLETLLVQRRRHGIEPSAAIEAVGTAHLGTIPLGGEALGEALDEGRLLSSRPGTPYGREVEHLAGRIATRAGLRDEGERKRPSRIGSLFEFVSARAASA